MNSRDTSGDDLRALFEARLDAAPEPPDSMFVRTLAAIGTEPREAANRPASWRSAARWWSALAAPTRFATAAAIVIVGGTIAFGTITVSHERKVAADSRAADRITLEPRAEHVPRFALSGSMQLAVRDLAATVRRIDALAARERGAVVAQRGGRKVKAPNATIRLTLMIPARSLDATMKAVALFGAVDARRVATADLASRLEETTDRLRRARITAHTLRAARPAVDEARVAALEAEITRLSAQRVALDERVMTATLAIVLRLEHAERNAVGTTQGIYAEPSLTAVRRTGILLARGSVFASHRSELTRRRVRSFDLVASCAAAGGSRAGGTATGRNDDPDRT